MPLWCSTSPARQAFASADRPSSDEASIRALLPSASSSEKLTWTPDPETPAKGLPRNVRSRPWASATSRARTRKRKMSSTARSASSYSSVSSNCASSNSALMDSVLKPHRLCGPHDVVDHAVGIRTQSGAVDHRAWRFPTLPTAVPVGFDDVRLELDAHLDRVAEVGPVGDRLLQSVPGGEGVRRALEVEMGHRDACAVIFPARSDRVGVHGCPNVLQPFEQVRAGGRDERAVVAESERTGAVAGTPSRRCAPGGTYRERGRGGRATARDSGRRQSSSLLLGLRRRPYSFGAERSWAQLTSAR